MTTIDGAKRYAQSVLDAIKAASDAINTAASSSGVSASMIAGPIAREMNKDAIDYNHDWIHQQMVAIRDKRILSMSNEQLEINLAYVLSNGITNTGGGANALQVKWFNPVLNDLGPGKFQLGTAMAAVNYYIDNINDFAGSLDLAKYAGHADQLVKDMLSPDTALSLAIRLTAVESKQAQSWFSTTDPSWNLRSEDYKAALITTWYTIGKNDIVASYNFQTANGLYPELYNPSAVNANGGVYYLFETNPATLHQNLLQGTGLGGSLYWQKSDAQVPDGAFSTAALSSLSLDTFDAIAGALVVSGTTADNSILKTTFVLDPNGDPVVGSQNYVSAADSTTTLSRFGMSDGSILTTTQDPADRYNWDFNTTTKVQGGTITTTHLDNGASVIELKGNNGTFDFNGDGVVNDLDAALIDAASGAGSGGGPGNGSGGGIISGGSGTDILYGGGAGDTLDTATGTKTRIAVTGWEPTVTHAGDFSFSNLAADVNAIQWFGSGAPTSTAPVTGSQIGAIFGNAISSTLLGDNLFARVVGGSAISTALSAIGGQFETYFGTGDGNPTVFNEITRQFETAEGLGSAFAANVRTSGIGVLSSFLTAEIAEGVGINSISAANDNAPAPLALAS